MREDLKGAEAMADDKKDQPQVSLCHIHKKKIEGLESTCYNNATGLKTRVNVLETMMDNLIAQNTTEHEDLKKALSKNTGAMIGFFVVIIVLLGGAILGVVLKG